MPCVIFYRTSSERWLNSITKKKPNESNSQKKKILYFFLYRLLSFLCKTSFYTLTLMSFVRRVICPPLLRELLLASLNIPVNFFSFFFFFNFSGSKMFYDVMLLRLWCFHLFIFQVEMCLKGLHTRWGNVHQTHLMDAGKKKESARAIRGASPRLNQFSREMKKRKKKKKTKQIRARKSHWNSRLKRPIPPPPSKTL